MFLKLIPFGLDRFKLNICM